MRSSAYLSFGSGIGISSSSSTRYWHRAGRMKLTSYSASFIIGSSTKLMSNKISLDVQPHLRDVVDIMGNDSTEFDYLDAAQDKSPSTIYCYLLQSHNPNHPLKTYIGFTTTPAKRLRQHNGELTRGARRTTSGRPWKYVAIIRGFQDKVSAMQFEWAWQHVDRSKVFREAVGSNEEARKMKRRRGVVARLKELRILLNDCDPFNNLPLKFYYLDGAYHDSFCNGSGDEDGLNQYRCSQDDLLLPTSGGNVNHILGSSMTYVKNHLLTKRLHVHQSRSFVNSITRNTLISMGARSKSNWALSAVSESNFKESLHRENVGVDDVEQIVKTPSKFKPYPFNVSDFLPPKLSSISA